MTLFTSAHFFPNSRLATAIIGVLTTACVFSVCVWFIFDATAANYLERRGLVQRCGDHVSVKDVLTQYAVAALCYWGESFFFLIVDLICESRRLLGTLRIPHPGYDPKRFAKKGLQHAQYQFAFCLAFFNTVFSFGLHLFITHPAYRYFKGGACDATVFPTTTQTTMIDALQSDVAAFFSAANTTVAWYHLLGTALIVVLVADVVFFSAHRWFGHEWKATKHFHYVHHSWKDSFAVVATAAHPVEHLIVNIPTATLPGYLAFLPFHWHSLWLGVASLVTVYTHCGYRLPLVFAHDAHHHFVDSEFGLDFVCDRLCGTTYADRYEAKQKRSVSRSGSASS